VPPPPRIGGSPRLARDCPATRRRRGRAAA
jgi:hypothetical protein